MAASEGTGRPTTPGSAALLDRGEHLLDRLGLALRLQVTRGPFTLGAQDARLPISLRVEDRGLLGALSGEDRGLLLALRGLDRRFPLAFCGQDGGAFLTVGSHLLFHRVLDGQRRIDRLELDPTDPDSPAPGRLVEHSRS